MFFRVVCVCVVFVWPLRNEKALARSVHAEHSSCSAGYAASAQCSGTMRAQCVSIRCADGCVRCLCCAPLFPCLVAAFVAVQSPACASSTSAPPVVRPAPPPHIRTNAHPIPLSLFPSSLRPCSYTRWIHPTHCRWPRRRRRSPRAVLAPSIPPPLPPTLSQIRQTLQSRRKTMDKYRHSQP